MSNIKSTNLRFNIDKPLYERAWTYLQNMDKSKFKSYSNVIAEALVEYFERYDKSSNDPYFETREREDEFIHKIVNTVENELEKALPSFLAACLAGLIQSYQTNTLEAVSNSVQDDKNSDEVDWNFLGG